jgi:hypothetical protein
MINACFWDGILQSLTTDDYKFIKYNKNIKKNKVPQIELINILKSKNILPSNVTWNNVKIREQEQKEHYTAIKEYDVKSIIKGYLCSTCDSFLLLLSQLFEVNIEHRYLGILIKYTNIKNRRKTVCFSSNKGHFKHVKNK